ncbi:hypothetical protein [Microbispora sp. NPDC046933]|uniref:hypothetical protein n=1 Tax=Microbispora sp. NPDC046933 TaxID=3155618 RepID=UPI0033CB431A
MDGTQMTQRHSEFLDQLSAFISSIRHHRAEPVKPALGQRIERDLIPPSNDQNRTGPRMQKNLRRHPHHRPSGARLRSRQLVSRCRAHRDFESGEVVWSNLMDPHAAAALLGEAEQE